MRAFFIIGIFSVLVTIASGSLSADQKVSEGKGKEIATDKKINFPYQLPNSRTDLDREIVDALNKLTSKKEQVQYLIKLLPDKEARNKLLTDKELNAIRLLGLTQSDEAIQPLLDRLEFGHPKDGSAAIHSLARHGERAVGSLTVVLHKTHDTKQIAAVIGVLRLIKGEEFPDFAKQLMDRKEIGPSSEARELLLMYSQMKKSLSG